MQGLAYHVALIVDGTVPYDTTQNQRIVLALRFRVGRRVYRPYFEAVCSFFG
jgi:hypothetical protein